MKSLSRALTLLAELSTRDEPLTLSDLSESVGMHKSTVHRMLATFIDYGLVSRDETKRYVVGAAARDLAQAAHGHASATVKAALTALGRDLGEAAFYAVPDGPVMRCVALTRGGGAEEPAQSSPPVHLHTTALGKAYLAYRPRDEITSYAMNEPFVAETPFTITDSRTLIRVLGVIRRRGYATEDRESNLRARRVGVAVLNPQGYAVAAVAVGVPPTADNAQLVHIPRAVMDCAADIESDLFGNRYPRGMPQTTTAPR